jgi:hypothetical protein
MIKLKTLPFGKIINEISNIENDVLYNALNQIK